MIVAVLVPSAGTLGVLARIWAPVAWGGWKVIVGRSPSETPSVVSLAVNVTGSALASVTVNTAEPSLPVVA